MKIKTDILQSMLKKSIKVLTNDLENPLTSIIMLRVHNNICTIFSTNLTDYLYISEPVTTEDFYCALDGTKFQKLISSITTEDVELIDDDKIIKIIGDGIYKLPKIIRGDGTQVKTSDVRTTFHEIDFDDHNFNHFSNIISVLKSSLATDFTIPCYTNYYFNDDVVTTNMMKISSIREKIFTHNLMLRPSTVELLTLFPDNYQTLYGENDTLFFKAANLELVTKKMPDFNDYQYDQIVDLLDYSCDSECVIEKSEILNIINRLSIFIKDNLLYIDIADNKLNLYNTEKEIIESIDNVAGTLKCKTSFSQFVSFIKSCEDNITIGFDEQFIQITSNNIVHILINQD